MVSLTQGSAFVVLPGSPCNYMGVVNRFAPVQAGVMHSAKHGHGQQAEVCVVIQSCSALSQGCGCRARDNSSEVSLSGCCFIWSVPIVASV